MKTRYIGLFFTTLLLTLAMVSCKKNVLYTTQPTPASESAQLKVINLMAYRNNPLYGIGINNVLISNILGGTTNPTPFPGGGLNTGGSSTPDYLAVNAGANTVSIATYYYNANPDSALLSNATVNLEAGKRYSLFFTDTLAKSFSVLVPDTLAMPDSGYAKYQFVNLMPDQPALDLYIGTVKVASNIAYRAVSTPFVLPTNNASTIWAIRTVNGTTNLVTYTSAASIGNQRVYNVFARGYNSITATTDFRRRAISLVYTR